ncbi:hypothetical protein LINPERPRIM_LOCUS42127 [Linum perenne]
MLANGELESGRGANQMTSLQRAGTTRWSSHLHSVDSMIQMYGATSDVLEDHQLSELNSRFNEDTIRLLQLSAALDPKDSFKAFNADHICELAEEFYPKDFDGHDILILKSELSLYTEHVVRNSEFEVSSLAKLMEKLVTRRLDVQYIMICRLIRLVLTLPVSTATTERAFSAMKIVKTDIRNKMGDDFLANSLMLFIERDYARKLDIDSIIDDFAKLKNRRVQLTINEG